MAAEDKESQRVISGQRLSNDYKTVPVLIHIFIYLLFKKMFYLFYRHTERDRECKRGRRKERGRHRTETGSRL